MKVVTRSGVAEDVSFDKIASRLRRLSGTKLSAIDVGRLVSLTASSMFDGISTSQLDELTAEISVSLASEHPDYGSLAARIIVSNWHKQTNDSVIETFRSMSSALSPAFMELAEEHAEDLQACVDYKRDYDFDFFGIRTFQRIYCTKIDGKSIERPQHVYLRVALAIGGADLKRVRECYALMSKKKYTHASPTLFNAGMKTQQLASCFLSNMEDSLDGIFKSLHDVAQISKLGGGIGMHVGNVRSKGSLIRSTNGASDGIIPMLQVANQVIRYVNQSGRRKGSMAIFLSPDHPDVLDFLDLRRPGGDENARCRDLFLALWTPDIFMRRVEANEEWSFFDPSACPGLNDIWGPAYDDLYTTYEKVGRATRTMPARDLWTAIIRSQVESGNPYLLYKDAANRCSNQQNLGTIKCSNLCSEIIEYTSPDEVAVCTLASLSLPAFIKNGIFDFKELHTVTRVAARNLDTVIDINAYPIPEAKNSNEKHRPIGIGIQGLADCFMMLGYAFESEEAALLNTQIAATMYHAAIEQSAELAREHGPYSSYEGSPASLGKLQYDLWGVEPDTSTGLLDWAALKRLVKRHGLRNSLSIALMPTASTSQLFGNNESMEPVTSLIYTRRTLAGEFTVVNKHLVNHLMELGMWNASLKDLIVANGGSVQDIVDIDDKTKSIYKTSWEISQRALIDQAAARGPYVCQSQSLNLFVADASLPRLSSIHFYAHRLGLKTGVYYLRTRAASQAKQITVSESLSCIACSS